MDEDSSPIAVEDKYVQRFSVDWIFTPRNISLKVKWTKISTIFL